MRKNIYSILLTGLLATTAFADVPPDEINVPKFQTIYENSKKISDARRATASELQGKAQAIDAQIANLQSRIRDTQNLLQSNIDQKSRLERENPELAEENQTLTSEISRHRSDIAANSATIDRLTSEMQSLQITLQEEQAKAAQLQQRFSQVSSDLQRANQDVANKESQLNQVNLSLRQALDNRSDSQRRLDSANNEISSARFSLDSEQRELQQLRSQLSTLQQNVSSLQSRYDSKKWELSPAEARVQEVKRLLTEIQRAVQMYQGQLDQANTQLRANEQQTADLRSRTAAVEAEIARLQAGEQTPDVVAQIASKQRDRVALLDQTANALRDHQTLDSNRSQAQANLDDYRRRQDEAQQNQARLQQDVDRIQRELQSLESELNAAKTALNRNTEQTRQSEQQVRELTSKLSTLDQSKRRLEQEIAQLNQTIPQLQSQAVSLDAELSRARNLSFNLTRERENLSGDISRQDQVVNGLKANYVSLETRARALSQQNQDLNNRIRQKQQQISENESTIRQNTAAIQSIAAEIPRIEANIAQLQSQLPPLQAQSTSAWEAFRPVDADAKTKEATTAQHLAKYLEVKRTYDARMLAARQAGEAQGNSQGRNDGDQKANSDGKLAGTQEGTAKGTEDGLNFGLQQGKKDGAQKGDADGYQHGLNAPENYNAGVQAGLKQGDLDAWDFAHKTEFPKGRAAKRTELLQLIPTNSVELDNNQGTAKIPQFLSNVNSIERKTLNFEIAINKAPRTESFFFDVAANKNGNILFTKASVTLESASCEHGWVEFNDACLASFKTAYQAAYDVAYKASEKVAHDAAFSEAHQIAFDNNKTRRYQEGYDFAYPTAFSQGDQRGATDARNKGYADGKVQGYNRTLPNAKAGEYQKGLEEETSYFQNNPVVRLLNASVTESDPEGEPGDLVPGDSLSLSLDAANFGKLAAPRGHVRISWTALTPNVATQGGVVDLAGIPANTKAKINNITLAKVATNAVAGTDVQLKVNFQSDSGGTQEAIVTAKVLADLPMKIDGIETDAQPKVGKATKLKVKVTNNAPVPSSAELKVVVKTSEPASVIRLDKAEEILKPMKSGKSDEAKLQYTILQNTGKDITLKVTVYHGKNVTTRGTVVVRAKP